MYNNPLVNVPHLKFTFLLVKLRIGDVLNSIARFCFVGMEHIFRASLIYPIDSGCCYELGVHYANGNSN